jgi:hypothetical protein
MNPWKIEPVAIAAVIRLGIYAAMQFGLNWTDAQVVAVMAFAEAFLALFVRQTVTSPATLEKAGTSKELVAFQAKQASNIPPVP